MELFRLLGTIAVENGDANKAISDTTERAGDAGSKISKAFSKIGSAAVKVGKTMAVGLAAGATAVAGLSKAAIDSYADYEQLTGGVETLFKDSASAVQEYAKTAYKTAGLSANEYMETVTGFSARLLQGLGGDTDKAAEIANRAITDMSDNANKMGTDMSLIQNAYQGFAKQNYTMLDNLKLGYGGTASEMARLINDSGVLGDAMEVTAETVNEVSFDKIIEAIGVVQDKMGITGTTAKEAASTISGSIASMKSSWSNLLTAISSDDLPFDDYVNAFVDSVSNVTDNLLPRIEVALNGVVKLVEQLAPKIIGKIPELFSQLLPAVLNAATGMMNALISAFPSFVDTLVNSMLPQMITGIVTLVNSLISALPSIIETLVAAFPTLIPLLINGIVSMIVTIASNFASIIQPLIDNLPNIIISIVGALVSNLPLLIDGMIQLVMGIVSAIPQIIQALISALPTIISMLITALISAIPQIIAGLIQCVGKIVTSLPQIFASLIQGVGNIFKGIWNGIKNIFGNVGGWFKDKFTDAKEKAAQAWSNQKEIYTKVWNKTKEAFSNVGSWFKDKFSKAKENSVKAWSNAKSLFTKVKDNVTGAFSNVKEKLSNPFQKARDSIGKVAEKIKGFFKGNISMPKIKMPHFSIKPKGWKFGDLLEGSIPKLGIEWYAKGAVLKQPTIFGMHGNKAMVGGEAGEEAIAPISTLQKYIGDAVARNDIAVISALNDGFDRLLGFLQEYIPEMANMKLVTDTGALIGELAPGMDVALGRLASKTERGVR